MGQCSVINQAGKRMTLLIWVSIVGSLLGLVVSNPQSFNCQGSRCTQNNAGSNQALSSATLNCAGSACTQNNAGRRKREIVAKVLEEIKAAGKEEHSAPPHDVPHHQPGGHIPPVHIPEVHIPPVHFQIPPVHVEHVPHEVPDVHVPKPYQEPAPSAPHGGGYGRKRRDVTQLIKAASKSGHKEVEENAREKNNAGSKKRGVVAEVIEEVRKISHQNKYVGSGQHATHPPTTTADGGGHVKREADPQSFNCQGSRCTQNNAGSNQALSSATLNCAGSACTQNNEGRRKREVIAAFLEEIKAAGKEEHSA